MLQDTDCTVHTTSCMIAQNLNLCVTWGRHSCSFGIPYSIKVVTNMYSCLCIRKRKTILTAIGFCIMKILFVIGGQ